MKKLLLVVAVLFVSSLSLAQLTAGKMAITTDIPGGSIGGAYALSANMRIDAGLTFNTVTPPSPATSSSTIGIGAGIKMYQPAMESVTMFYGGNVGFSNSGPSGAKSTTISVKGLAGAEYWFSPRFAWGGYVSLGFSSSGASGATTSTLGTQGASTTLTWWFN